MDERGRILEALWEEVIDAPLTERWIDKAIAAASDSSREPFADAALAVRRLVAMGASRRDLSLILRHGKYEAVFSVLSCISEDLAPDFRGLHESLLSADPSGLEGRRAPEKA